MVKLSVKNNIISIIRDPTTILAILATFIMRFINGFGMYRDTAGNFVDAELFLSDEALYYALNSYVGFAISTLQNIVVPFLGIIIAINIFKDIRTNMLDIISTCQLSLKKYFISKILSYHFFGSAILVLLTSTYSVLYAFVNIPAGVILEWDKVFIAQIVTMIVIGTSYLFIPIAWAIFLSALTGISSVGAIFNSVYLYLPSMIVHSGITFWEHYVHIFPHTMYLYLLKWVTYPKELIFNFEYRDSYGPEASRMFTSFSDALLSYSLQILIAAVLLTSAYFLLKRRFQKT